MQYVSNKVVVFGPGPQFKGGLANYTLSLAKALDTLYFETTIISWTQQYPAIVPRDFIDRATKSDKLAGSNVRVEYITNYNNPVTWKNTVAAIVAIQPQVVIFQWSIAIQGLPLYFITKWLKKKLPNTEIIFDLHFVIQKEQSKLDRYLSKLALNNAHTFVVHALKTFEELKQLLPHRKYTLTETGKRTSTQGSTHVIKLFHPVYDMFKPRADFDVAAFKAKNGLKAHVFLFFGFIRKYKGLHHCIHAFNELCRLRDDVSLLIVGESFWHTLDERKWSTRLKNFFFKTAKRLFLSNKEDEKDYRPLELIEQYGLQDKVMVVNSFVADEDVYQYFQVSDAILLFYEYATPSGVESMAYNFKLPILATSVGHFPETVKHGYNGYLAPPGQHEAMAAIMQQAIIQPIPAAHVDASASAFSWENYARAIMHPYFIVP
jgi:glycosyltransferase involved in cell wall biosynthesis